MAAPDNGPAAFNDLIYYQFIGLVHQVNIQIKIIVDDITCCGNQYRSGHERNKNGVEYLAH
jgi:hypothetical protein